MTSTADFYIIRGFKHIFGTKNVFLQTGSYYYLSLVNSLERQEAAWMLSSSFPNKADVHIKVTPEILALMGGGTGGAILASDVPPDNPQPGTIYFNITARIPYYWDGDSWEPLAGTTGGGTALLPALSGDLVSSGFDNAVQIAPGAINNNDISPTAAITFNKLEKNPLNRAFHFGTQTTNTISDFVPTVRTVPLNELAIPQSNVNLNNKRIINLAHGAMDNDAVNYKQLIDTIANINDLPNLSTPLRLDQGGTGVVANSPIEALNGLLGIADGVSLGTPVDGVGVYVSKETNTGSVPSILKFKRIKAGSGISVNDLGNSIEIALGGTNKLNINTALEGYPLELSKGGTGATVPLTARINLGAVGRGENTLADSVSVGNVFRDIVPGTDLIRFRSLVEGVGINLDQQTAIDRVSISIKPESILLQDLGGSLILSGAQVSGLLPINKGGTDAETVLDARLNLGAVGNVISLGGVSVVGTPSKDVTSGDPTIVRLRGLSPSTLKPNIKIEDIDPNVITLSVDEPLIDINNLGGTLDLLKVTGILPIVKGGTGASTASLARLNLGIINRFEVTTGSTGMSLLPPNPVVSVASDGFKAQIKGLKPGVGITITDGPGSTDLIISSTIGTLTGSNVGTGPGRVFESITASDIKFRTINAGVLGGIQVITSGSNILLTPNLVNLINAGTGAKSVKPFALPGATVELRSFRTPNSSLIQDGLVITENTDHIEFRTNIANVTSVGTGAKLINDPLTGPGITIQVRTLNEAPVNPGIEITEAINSVTLQTIIAGLSSVGTGIPLIKTLTPITTPGTIVELKTLIPGKGTTVLEGTDDISVNLNVINTGGETELTAVNPTTLTPGAPLELRTLKAGQGITLTTPTPQTIEISSNIPNYTYSNIGAGTALVYKGLNGNTYEYRTLAVATGNRLLITPLADQIDLDVNEAALNLPNLSGVLPITKGGTGTTTIPGIRDILNVVFNGKDASGISGISLIQSVDNAVGEGKILNFRSIKPGPNISIVPTGSTSQDLEISCTYVDVPTPASNVGAGTGQVYVPASLYEFKTLATAATNPGLVIENLVDTVVFKPLIGAVQNVTGLGESVVNNTLPLSGTNQILEFKRIKAETNSSITVSTVGNEIEVGIGTLGYMGTITTASTAAPFTYVVPHNLGLDATGNNFIVTVISSTGAILTPSAISASSGGSTTFTFAGATSPGALSFRMIKVGPYA